jgi:transglutaminase-like putative cysteine protease
MEYQINHRITYSYASPVSLDVHYIRLRPRCDPYQQLTKFDLTIHPQPLGQTGLIDQDGNGIYKIWFAPTTTTAILEIIAQSTIITHRNNPFDFLLEPWATHLPIDYPLSHSASITPYLQPYLGIAGISSGFDPVAVELAQNILSQQAPDGNVINFLVALNQTIANECQHEIRDQGAPYAPGVTWRNKSGACRDFTVLFMECCRSVGLAAQFISGYQQGDPDTNERHLHAWAEVYLPGAGWLGFDPTQGLLVADEHITLVATANPALAAPVTGKLRSIGVNAQMNYDLSIIIG